MLQLPPQQIGVLRRFEWPPNSPDSKPICGSTSQLPERRLTCKLSRVITTSFIHHSCGDTNKIRNY